MKLEAPLYVWPQFTTIPGPWKARILHKQDRSGIGRRRYNASEKIAILSQIWRVKRETNVSYYWAAAAEYVGVSHTLVFWWCSPRPASASIALIPRGSPAILLILALVVNLRAWRKPSSHGSLRGERWGLLSWRTPSSSKLAPSCLSWNRNQPLCLVMCSFFKKISIV